MDKVLYVGYYDILRNGQQIRNYSLAAAKKMNFVFESVAELGYHVDVVSPSFIKTRDNVKVNQTREKLESNVDLVLTPSWGAKNKISRIARVLYSNFWLFSYLLKNTQKNTPVLVYHNYALALPVLVAQKIKKFHLILEIEEQYSMVWKLTSYQKWKENALLKKGKKDTLVVSELLAEKLGVENPIVSYGSYSAFKGTIPERFVGDGRTRLVYTGSIDKVKGSAFTAIEAMKYLPDNYELKISGSVAAKDKNNFDELIKQTNKGCGRNAVEYLGLLDEQQYEKLLLSANIALNPQKEGGFGQYLFPSKILTYMSYGLPVVSTRGESIVKSKVADLITFSEGFDGKSVADAIQNVVVQDCTIYQSRLDELGDEFSEELANILGNEGRHKTL